MTCSLNPSFGNLDSVPHYPKYSQVSVRNWRLIESCLAISARWSRFRSLARPRTTVIVICSTCLTTRTYEVEWTFRRALFIKWRSQMAKSRPLISFHLQETLVTNFSLTFNYIYSNHSASTVAQKGLNLLSECGCSVIMQKTS